jgi:phosphinothricin acetyltransferase
MTVSDRPAIRSALTDDMPAITAIYAVHIREGLASFELTPPSANEMAKRFAAIQQAGLPYLVAELDGRVAGYCYASYYRPRSAYRNTVENSVYIAPWAQRRGVGKALLDEIIRACEAIGKRQMIAVIGDTDNLASIALHKAAGFHHVGTLRDVGFKHGRWVDSVIMQRSLGPGAQMLPEDEDHLRQV